MKVVIEKVKKLLALGRSNEPHESALALQRARSLMDKHGITSTDLEVADIQPRNGAAGRYKTPPEYITELADVCADLFECGVYYMTESQPSNFYRPKNVYQTRPVFIGAEPQNEICGYTYDVLVRQLIRARRSFRSKEWHPSLITRDRDSYARGWVEAIRSKVADMVPPKPKPTIADETGLVALTAVEAYIKREVKGSFDARSCDLNRDALHTGYVDGLNVDVRKGMGTTDGKALASD
jgi:hypothetical protein